MTHVEHRRREIGLRSSCEAYLCRECFFVEDLFDLRARADFVDAIRQSFQRGQFALRIFERIFELGNAFVERSLRVANLGYRFGAFPELAALLAHLRFDRRQQRLDPRFSITFGGGENFARL